MRLTDHAAPFISGRLAVISAFQSSIVLVSSCYPSSLLLYHSPIVFFFYHGHPRLRNFYSAIHVDVIGMKSYVDSFLDPTFVPVKVSIDKVNLVPN